MTKNRLVILLIIIFSLVVRFYNFPSRINFGPEQAISLITSASYINEKFSLLGQPYYHQTINGQTLFYGPQFNYLLVPLLLIFKHNPVPITAFFVFVNLFCGLVIYWLSKKLTDQRTAVIAFAIFMFNSTMINHSLFIWSLHFFPAIGFACFYLLWNLKSTKHQSLAVLILGILSGLGISLEYPFGIYTVLMLVLIFVITRKKLISVLIFLLGNMIGNFPMVLFDIKHDFYNLRSLIGYAQLQTVQRTQGMDYFHYIELWGVFCLIVAILLQKFFGKKKVLQLLIILLYIVANLVSPDVSFTKAIGMPNGTNIWDIQNQAYTISKNTPTVFNVASLMDFDTRAHPLRYYLTYVYKKTPQDYTQYSNLDSLYVVSPPGYDLGHPLVWELQAYQPYSQQLLQSKTDTWQLTQLTKIQNKQ